MATTLENSTPISLFPEFSCCGGALHFVIHLYEDTNSWEARCPKCHRIWWLECIGIESEIYKKDGVMQDVKVKVSSD